MFSIPHLIVIFIVALVVFGPEKIPELARNLGKVMAEFRRVTGDLRSTFEGHLRDLEREADTRRIAAPNTPAAAATAPASAIVPTAVPANPPPADPPPGPASPGTVPANPPYAAAVGGISATPAALPDNEDARGLPDPMHDPYLMHMDFPTPDGSGVPQPPEPEEKPERVTDGDGRAS